jgi:hypothetical protein
MVAKPNDDEPILLGLAPAPKPFTGRLKAPIIYSDRAFREQQKKLELLFQHYGINALSEADRWKALAYAIACHLVPGMKVQKRAPRERGRPRTRKELKSAKHLVETIDSIRRERKKGIRDAARQAKKRHPNGWPELSDKSLVTRYYEALNLLSDVEALLARVNAKRT